MGVDLRWEDERGNKIAGVEDPQNHFVKLLSKSDLSKTHCLQYIDFYGDTVFNRIQIPVFIDELVNILKESSFDESRNIAEQILILSNKCLKRVHTYLKFYGD